MTCREAAKSSVVLGSGVQRHSEFHNPRVQIISVPHIITDHILIPRPLARGSVLDCWSQMAEKRHLEFMVWGGGVLGNEGWLGMWFTLGGRPGNSCVVIGK